MLSILKSLKCCCLMDVNSLIIDKILDETKLTALADRHILSAKKLVVSSLSTDFHR